jgi:hypothetical protein
MRRRERNVKLNLEERAFFQLFGDKFSCDIGDPQAAASKFNQKVNTADLDLWF